MIEPKKIHEFLYEIGITFLTGVPDSLLNDFCQFAETLPVERHVITANEGNAVALAAGHYLSTGDIPLVYMQNSGLGNAVNPLVSLTNKDVYGIPLVLLVGWRGDPAVADHIHHKKQGELTTVLLKDMDIPYKILQNEGKDAFNSFRWAVETAKKQMSPSALVVKKGILAKADKKNLLAEPSEFEMSREDAIGLILRSVPKNTLFVATTGRATRELHEQRRLMGGDHGLDFLNIGAMGHASAIANGLALGAKDRLVVCLDGDAAAVMHMGSMAITKTINAPNLLHIILNNGAHESVGGQESVGHQVGFTKIAESCGYETVGECITTKEALHNSISALTKRKKPCFIDVRIRKGIRGNVPKLDVMFSHVRDALLHNNKTGDTYS